MENIFDSFGRQIYTCLCCNLLSFAYGTSVGWASSNLPSLETNQTTLQSGPISKDESSWIQSTFTLGGLLGSLIYGLISNRFGPKRALVSIAIFQLVSWSLVVFAQQWQIILVSRLIGGVSGGGLYIIIPNFISEISTESIRGRLGSVFILAFGSGVLFAYICGTFISYTTLPFVYSIFSVLFLVGTLFHPESPFYLLQRLKDEERAKNAIKFFKGRSKAAVTYSNDSSGNGVEIIQMNNEIVKIEFESIKSLISEGASPAAVGGSSSVLKDLTTKPALKVLTIGIGLLYLEQFSGVFALLFIVSSVFEKSGSRLSPAVSSIVVGVIQLIGAYISTTLVDRTGRRFLIALSAYSMSMGFLVFSSYTHFASDIPSSFNWIPLASLSFVFLVSNFGVLTLPFLVMSELMITLPRVRGIIYSFCLSLSWIFAFLILKYQESVNQLIGIGGLMLFFSVNSLLGALFVQLYVPETKDKTFQEISDVLEGRKREAEAHIS